jgi:hypothetical protein
MRSRAWKRAAAGSSAIVGVLCLAGCSSGGSGGNESVPRTSQLAPSATVPFDPADNARSEVIIALCSSTSGAWVAHGSVHNAAKTTKTFKLVVDFASHPGLTVLSSTAVTIPDVTPDATVAWSARGAPGAPAVSCILRQAQAT